MRLTKWLAAGAAICAAGSIAWAAGMWSTLPIVGQPSFCISTVSGAGGFNAAGNAGGGGATGQGQASSGSLCAQTIPAGPPSLTGNELIPADTGAQVPATVTIPVGMLASFGSNVLVGPDFGVNLWQRGTTPISAAAFPAGNNALYGPDGWYAYVGAATPTVTVSKQTGATDIPTNLSNTTASARIQRVASQTALTQIQFGQLIPNDTSQRFPGNTAIFSCHLLAGANFSPTNGNVSMVIAYHTAADASAAANGQGTNTGTFASSAGTTQNITNYTEAVNSTVAVTTTWTRFSVAAAIPQFVPNTTTQVLGVGVKLQWTPVGTAGTNDWLEVANCQLESRAGTSVGPSGFNRRLLSDEYALETARYWQLTENGSGSDIFCPGQATTTNGFNITCQFPGLMRITPVTTPITIGGFKTNSAGTLQTISVLNVVGVGNTQRTGNLSGTGTITAGQGTSLVGSGAGTGVIGFSAEP